MLSVDPGRIVRRLLLVAVGPIVVSLSVSACAASDSKQDARPAAQVDAGDLKVLDVNVHQAVG